MPSFKMLFMVAVVDTSQRVGRGIARRGHGGRSNHPPPLLACILEDVPWQFSHGVFRGYGAQFQSVMEHCFLEQYFDLSFVSDGYLKAPRGSYVPLRKPARSFTDTSVSECNLVGKVY